MSSNNSYPTELFDEVASLYQDYANSYEEGEREPKSVKEQITSKMNKSGYTLKTGTYRHVWKKTDSPQGYVVKFGVGRLGGKQINQKLKTTRKFQIRQLQTHSQTKRDLGVN